ncbi:MAG: DMT family transporter [Rhodospirillales bacterium]|jgi:drug/metabolite transporter (DMT)-like permease|nr:DMT family transporter [Rhodospirillales bacterium]
MNTAPSISSSLKGIACMIGAGAFLMMNNAVIKLLTATVPVGQILFVRGLFVSVPIALLAWRAGGIGSLRIQSLSGQAWRAALTAVSTLLMTNALGQLPLADVTAITFAGPLFITCLATWVLGERVGWRRWTAVVVGFTGVILMTRPTGEALRWAIFLPLGVALVGAVRDIITRRMSVTETSVSMLCYTSIGVALSGLVTWPFGWTVLETREVGLLALAACLLGTAQFLGIECFRHAEAAVAAPFKYSEILWAVVIGALIWGHLPDAWIVAGSALVVGSGLYILRRETRRRRRPYTKDQ